MASVRSNKTTKSTPTSETIFNAFREQIITLVLMPKLRELNETLQPETTEDLFVAFRKETGLGVTDNEIRSWFGSEEPSTRVIMPGQSMAPIISALPQEPVQELSPPDPRVESVLDQLPNQTKTVGGLTQLHGDGRNPADTPPDANQPLNIPGGHHFGTIPQS